MRQNIGMCCSSCHFLLFNPQWSCTGNCNITVQVMLMDTVFYNHVQTVFPLGVKGMCFRCLAWRLNHLHPCYTTIPLQDIMMASVLLCPIVRARTVYPGIPISDSFYNPVPQLSADTNSRSQRVHMLWVRVVFYNINGKF